ncbi:polysaccharide deacetylase family protein [Priestia flexa]|uniref:Polysaccharide deacetylase family protein n=1 Tax=Priestia flexa TaxID=86664 RepID=A0ABU4J4I1_9BACI|nr:polysaccharide deacetylase family protein [Priestia flexa]MCG7313696.1 polysaccharide deacetylase family protein [Priestia flexa]MDW8515907.1 polysaccharide deacetylase family protein [Priestia flexa]MEC0668105.1 polysaccharide deacetylase family protein [Priestia flexa]MED3823829.1 polysaccharide deacetylase family protein [Priestia flexa]QCS52813.1 polysaccharide deacetylase family protein [Priestia flexa]
MIVIKWFLVVSLVIGFCWLLYAVFPTYLYRWFHPNVYINVKRAQSFALTFDDGPHREYTVQILNLLKEHEMKATFFVVGSIAEEQPDLLKRMVMEGHEIGIHHYNHVSAWFLTPGRLKKEIQMCKDVIIEAAGVEPIFYRPPWGHLNLFSIWCARPCRTIIWSNIFGDWSLKKTKRALEAEMKSKLKRGAVYVLHDNGETKGADEKAPEHTIGALREFIPYAKQHKMNSKTLSELQKEGTSTWN